VDVQEFYMAQTEVTEGQWYALMGGDQPSRREMNLPKTEVNWHDCTAFCEKLGAILGCDVGLPHEVEWEYAARGGQNYTYAGSNNPDEVAWYSENSGNRTHPVGQKKPNGYGLYDMSGNVWEWCQNAYGSVADAVNSYKKLVGKTRSNPRRRRTRRPRRR
jgi:formylglycine-generating enzyme required for sulfatase activity